MITRPASSSEIQFAQQDSLPPNSRITKIKSELDRRRQALIELAHRSDSNMPANDPWEIIEYLERCDLPKRPDSIPELMRSFITSCFSYAVIRNYCSSFIADIPTPDTISICLSNLFGRDEFKHQDTWLPENLKALVIDIQPAEKFDLNSKKPKPRMIRVMIDGADEMQRRLSKGLIELYKELGAVNDSESESMWRFVSEFSKPIHNVGPNLICDFLKQIGYANFVKVDHHFMRQFPDLLGIKDCSKLINKKHFFLSQQLAS